jgi:glycosyltransferase involved in cell wall biosynthesis
VNHEDIFVSVIIPVYNGERFIDGVIKNVQEQDYAPLEIIIIDDGSTDGTADAVASFRDKIRCIHQENRGPAAARNRGINMSSGNVIAFLDVDDLWPRNKVKRQVSFLEDNPCVEIVQGLIQEFALYTPIDPEKVPLKASSKTYNFINLGCAVFRKSVFDKVGLFDETLRFNEDTDWFFRAWENNIAKIVLKEVSLFYRKHDGNMTRDVGLVESGFVRLFKKHLDRCRAKGITPSGGLHSLSHYIGWANLAERGVKKI